VTPSLAIPNVPWKFGTNSDNNVSIRALVLWLYPAALSQTELASPPVLTSMARKISSRAFLISWSLLEEEMDQVVSLTSIIRAASEHAVRASA
jgi:hypothetical protein